MLLVAYFANTKWCKKAWKITETLAYGYSSESARWELSNEYKHNKVKKLFQKYVHPCALDKGSLSIIEGLTQRSFSCFSESLLNYSNKHTHEMPVFQEKHGRLIYYVVIVIISHKTSSVAIIDEEIILLWIYHPTLFHISLCSTELKKHWIEWNFVCRHFYLPYRSLITDSLGNYWLTHSQW